MNRSVMGAVLVGTLGFALLLASRGPRGTTDGPGVMRAAGDAESPNGTRGTSTPDEAAPRAGQRGPAGSARPGDGDARADTNARSVIEATQTGRYPERLTALVTPRPFDRDAFEADPDAYLDVIEPGRVWQTARAGQGVKPLDSIGPAFAMVRQGGRTELAVLGEPMAPVTFTSFDLGAFANGLTSITVRSDGAGRARVTFTATKGTIADVHILAASPLAAGHVRFLVRVLPEG